MRTHRKKKHSGRVLPARRPRKAKDVSKGKDIAGNGDGRIGESVTPAKPRPLFEIGSMIAVAAAVCESRVGKIVGYEFSPKGHSGWVYWVQFYVNDPRPEVNHIWPSNRHFVATETEVVEWQKPGKVEGKGVS